MMFLSFHSILSLLEGEMNFIFFIFIDDVYMDVFDVYMYVYGCM